MMFEQLAIIGCGLMGGSFALALKRAGLVKRVVGYSKSPSTTERARKLGVIDVEAPRPCWPYPVRHRPDRMAVAATETLSVHQTLVTPQMLLKDLARPNPKCWMLSPGSARADGSFDLPTPCGQGGSGEKTQNRNFTGKKAFSAKRNTLRGTAKKLNWEGLGLR